MKTNKKIFIYALISNYFNCEFLQEQFIKGGAQTIFQHPVFCLNYIKMMNEYESLKYPFGEIRRAAKLYELIKYYHIAVENCTVIIKSL